MTRKSARINQDYVDKVVGDSWQPRVKESCSKCGFSYSIPASQLICHENGVPYHIESGNYTDGKSCEGGYLIRTPDEFTEWLQDVLGSNHADKTIV